MLFTREPIIETVITARNGYRLCVRNSKSPVEELLVDALEIVSFGQALFFRCIERPKAFLLPVSDYEVSEVRETRLVLKHMAQEVVKKHEPNNRSLPKQEVRLEPRAEEVKQVEASPSTETVEAKDAASRNDRRRERRRQRRRRGDSRSDASGSLEEDNQEDNSDSSSEPVTSSFENTEVSLVEENLKQEPVNTRSKSRSRNPVKIVNALLPPPSTLVSDLFRYEHLDDTKVREEVEGADPQIHSVRHEFVDALHTHTEESPSL